MSGFGETREGHPSGEGPGALRDVARDVVKVDTYSGVVHVEWAPDTAVTPLGHLAFFAEYLKVSGRFDALVADCPLHYTSPNAPPKRDVLGTVLLSVLATSLDLEALSSTQLYRDRTNVENGFDELKNQWGWSGFTTRDLKRCRHMARLIPLIYNWWSLFVRLADPDRHLTLSPTSVSGGQQ